MQKKKDYTQMVNNSSRIGTQYPATVDVKVDVQVQVERNSNGNTERRKYPSRYDGVIVYDNRHRLDIIYVKGQAYLVWQQVCDAIDIRNIEVAATMIPPRYTRLEVCGVYNETQMRKRRIVRLDGMDNWLNERTYQNKKEAVAKFMNWLKTMDVVERASRKNRNKLRISINTNNDKTIVMTEHQKNDSKNAYTAQALQENVGVVTNESSIDIDTYDDDDDEMDMSGKLSMDGQDVGAIRARLISFCIENPRNVHNCGGGLYIEPKAGGYVGHVSPTLSLRGECEKEVRSKMESYVRIKYVLLADMMDRINDDEMLWEVVTAEVEQLIRYERLMGIKNVQ